MRAFLEKQRGLIDYAALSLWRRKGKTALLWSVYATLVFLLASVLLFGSALRREAALVLQEAPDIVAQNMVMGRHDLSRQDNVTRLQGLRGVSLLEGRLWGYHYDTASAANYLLQVPSPRDAARALEPGQAFVGEGVARLRKLEANKPLFLVSAEGRLLKLVVKEVLPQASALVSSDLVLVSEADFRSFFSLPPDRFTDIVLRVRNPSEIDTVAQKASVLLPAFRFITKANMQRSYEALFSWREGLVLATLAGALLAFVILAFDHASGLSAQERREIGTLRAVGWEISDIIAMKLGEGLIVAATAFMAGFVAAFLHVFAFSGGLFEPVLKGWSTLYPRFPLSPAIDPLELTTLAFFTIVPYAAAILVPVWRVASSDPEAVMR